MGAKIIEDSTPPHHVYIFSLSLTLYLYPSLSVSQSFLNSQYHTIPYYAIPYYTTLQSTMSRVIWVWAIQTIYTICLPHKLIHPFLPLFLPSSLSLSQTRIHSLHLKEQNSHILPMHALSCHKQEQTSAYLFLFV